MAQLMPLPLTISCSSKIQTGFTFVVPAHLGSPGQRTVKWVCACVCEHGISLCVKEGSFSKTLVLNCGTSYSRRVFDENRDLHRIANINT